VPPRFAPSWAMTVLAFALCALFVCLGRWQWSRGDMREAQWQEFARGADRVRPLGTHRLGELPRFQRIGAVGRFDSRRQFLLDNRIRAGQAGYEVLTPFMLPDGHSVLVDRGWVPFTGYRNRLPDVAFAAGGQRSIVGRVDELPSAGLAQGRAMPAVDASWPKLTSYPGMQELSAALGYSLEARILLLDPREADGYVRDWQPPGLPPLRHWSYAIQWWAFAAATLVLWLVLNLRRKLPTI
jgi:surfeit locus 1 family protein